MSVLALVLIAPVVAALLIVTIRRAVAAVAFAGAAISLVAAADLLIRAFAGARDELAGWQLVIAGRVRADSPLFPDPRPVARELGLSYASIYRWEGGETEPKFDYFPILAKLYRLRSPRNLLAPR